MPYLLESDFSLTGIWNVEDENFGKKIFFDIDAVWNNESKRSYLYPVLKSKNFDIVTLVYDVIPIKYPQYCHKDTVIRFIDYLSAVLKYSDLIITNTENGTLTE